MWWNKKEEEPKKEYVEVEVEVKLHSAEEVWSFKSTELKGVETLKHKKFLKEVDRLLKWWEIPEKGDYFVFNTTDKVSSVGFERTNVEYIWKKSPTVFLR